MELLAVVIGHDASRLLKRRRLEIDLRLGAVGEKCSCRRATSACSNKDPIHSLAIRSATWWARVVTVPRRDAASELMEMGAAAMLGVEKSMRHGA